MPRHPSHFAIILNKVFQDNHTNVEELLLNLFSPGLSTPCKRILFELWKDKYYSFDDIREFFSDTLFKEDGSETYMDVILKCGDYDNFYELALTLDMDNFDPKVYYIYWILTVGNQTDKKVLEDALEYDPDGILGMFPDIKEVVLS